MQPPAWMTHPPWFLVTGLPWPEDHANIEMAEAAFAIAPDVTKAVRPAGPEGKPIQLGPDLAGLLDTGSRCSAVLGKRVIFLSDITGWLADAGLSWERVGVTFGAAQHELEQQPLGLLVMVSSHAYSILCSTVRNLTIRYTSGSAAELPIEERELVRSSFEARLDADWPDYVTRRLTGAQPAA